MNASRLNDYIDRVVDFVEFVSLRLGPVDISVRANRPIPETTQLFPGAQSMVLSDQHSDHHAYHLSYADPRFTEELGSGEYWSYRDDTFRGDRFSEGFYLTHHYGPPAALSNYGRSTALVGTELARPMWGYYIKRVLMAEAVRVKALNLKAACVEVDGNGVLLVGRGKGGKTIATLQMCVAGAKFVSNTHCLVSGQTAHGFLTGMRIRKDPAFAALISDLHLPSHLSSFEYNVSPHVLFPQHTSEANIKTIVIVDYDPSRPNELIAIEPRSVVNFLMRFSGSVDTYAMKDDLLELVNGSARAFEAEVIRQARLLEQLLDNVKVYESHLDMMHRPNVERLMNTVTQK